MSNKSGVDPGVISLPTGGGAVKGIGETFSSDPQTGTGTFTIPITLPPGRNGFTPSLTLSYSSGHGNGPFGLGWSVSVPSISRKTAQGIPRYRDDSPDPADHDTFILSGAEELVPVPEPGAPSNAIGYRPRTEGNFARIRRYRAQNQDDWEVWSRDGLVSTYGTGRAFVANPATPEQIFAWKLASTVDPFGNRIEYSYEPDALAADGPHVWDQVYLSEIRYADYGDPAAPSYLITVRFLYESRPDPFSEYKAGFEIRTVRRCRGIEILTKQNGVDTVVRRYHLTYLDQVGLAPERLPLNGLSLLAQVQAEGVDGSASESLPPVTFAYTEFSPDGRQYQALSARDGHLPERSLGHGEYELVDLFGNGLPDVVQIGAVARYWRNLGGGLFDAPRTFTGAPAAVSLAAAGVQMADLNGDGRADLLVTDGVRTGYYSVDQKGGWDSRSFVRYDRAPSFRLDDPDVKLVDLNGDGVTDLLRAGAQFELFYHDAARGWTEVEVRSRAGLDQFPDVSFQDPRVRLADLTGDGQQAICMVRDGEVTYWPSMGYGRWGKPVTMANSPRFEDALRYSGIGFDPRRLLIGDVDGDGLDDMVYVGSGHVTVWINQSGNGWSDPVQVTGTPGITDHDAVRLADMLGTGTSGILWTYDYHAQVESTYKFLDLTGGVKPYLLCGMQNGLGAETKVEYCSSTRFYLEDEQEPATRWQTPLPFPVQVVARVEVVDRLSGGTLTTRFRYHHGYWDGAEREFRGFGMVEQFDTEAFDSASGVEQFSPPLLTRTWFHQGPLPDPESGWREPDFSDQFWPGDRALFAAPPELETLLAGLPPEARPELWRALRGRILRTETYALDGSDRADRPYTVTEHLYSVREESAPTPSEGARRRIFFPHQKARRTTHWERGNDPLTTVDVTLAYDQFGQVRSQLSVAVPRGRDLRSPAPASQTEPYLAVQTETEYARQVTGSTYMVDRQALSSTWEILNDGTQPLLAFIDSIRAGMAARQLVGQSVSFYDGPAFTGLDYGQIDRFGALVRTETLVITEALLAQAYPAGDPLLAGETEPPYWATSGTPAYPASYPGAQTALYPTGQQADATRPNLAITPLGYGFSPGGGPYVRGFYASARRKYDFQAGSAAPRGLVVALLDPRGNATSITHDPHQLLPETVTDAAQMVTRAEYDPRTRQPALVTDASGSRKFYRYTPLGLLAKSGVMGKAGESRGDTPSEPGVRYQYDLWAFASHGKPVSVRTVRRLHHVHDTDVPLPARDETQISVEYADGFGRLLQTRVQAEELSFGDPVFGGDVLPADQAVIPGDAVGQPVAQTGGRVIVSGWQLYDNKGRVIAKYEPFFDEGWEYAPPQTAQYGQKIRQYYDPRGRLVRTLYPDGAEERVVHGIPYHLTDPDQYEPTPWESYTYDVNDNAGRSPQAPAAAAYADHWNTPASARIDALGRLVERVERNGADPGKWYTSRHEYDISGNVLRVLDQMGRVMFQHQYDLQSRVLRTLAADSGPRRATLAPGGEQVELRDGKGALLLRAYDALNRPVRLWARDRSGEQVTLRQRLIYGDSAESGLTAAQAGAANLLGKLYRQYDEAGLLTYESYDFKGNVLEKLRRVFRDNRILEAFRHARQRNWQVTPFRADWEPGNMGLDAYATPLLDAREYRTSFTYDARGRSKSVRYPADAQGARRLLRPSYNRVGQLARVELDGQSYVRYISYNARGQRTLIAYGPDAGGKGLLTRYAHDPLRGRLVRMRTERYQLHSSGPLTFHPTAPHQPLQELGYRYDLAGNLLAITERTPGSGIANTPSGPDALDRTFLYDPLYRLLEATGRECDQPPPPPPWLDAPRCTDLTRTRAYTERYQYDPAGNLTGLNHQHRRADGTVAGVNRQYGLAPGTNRLQTVTVGADQFAYSYDSAGNLVQENTERHYEWDHGSRLRVFRVQPAGAEPSLHCHYLYDAAGQRVLKLVRRQGGGYEVIVYIDGIFEHYRWNLRGGQPKENTRLHVLDTASRIAVRRDGDRDDNTPDIQYHLGDHLGSSHLAVDESGAWVNREEYTPYGETSFGSFARKRYRFTGKERDEESGLYYHGARYYAPWLARWTSCDPAGLEQQEMTREVVPLYRYAANNPLRFTDPTGLSDDDTQAAAATDDMAYDEDYLNEARRSLIAPKIGENARKLPPWAEFFASLNPFISAVEAGTGKSSISGEELSGTERLMSAPGVDAVLGTAAGVMRLGKKSKFLDEDIAEVMVEEQQRGIRALDNVDDEGLSFVTSLKRRLGLGDPRELLAYNMTKMGSPRPPGHEAHHIVALEDPRADRARELLDEAGIGINDEVNGIWLPKSSTDTAAEAQTLHPEIHTDKYFEEITRRLESVPAEERSLQLRMIHYEIRERLFPY